MLFAIDIDDTIAGGRNAYKAYIEHHNQDLGLNISSARTNKDKQNHDKLFHSSTWTQTIPHYWQYASVPTRSNRVYAAHAAHLWQYGNHSRRQNACGDGVSTRAYTLHSDGASTQLHLASEHW